MKKTATRLPLLQPVQSQISVGKYEILHVRIFGIPRSFSVLPEKIKAHVELRILRKSRELQNSQFTPFSRFLLSPSGDFIREFFSALRIFTVFVNFVEEFNPRHFSAAGQCLPVMLFVFASNATLFII